MNTSGHCSLVEKPKPKIAVTGATGFVGSRFLEYNAGRYEMTRLDLRKNGVAGLPDLSGVEAIVHFAGLAHQMKRVPDEWYFQTNVDLTRQLIVKAKEQGVGYFIYVSSTKVYGDGQAAEMDEMSDCHPADPYGLSKLQAEQFVLGAANPRFRVAIVRPPVVYGPKVKGNILKLLSLTRRNWPLPFGQIQNARSMVYIDNLVALIDRIIDNHSEGVFVAGDLEPVSTEALLRQMQMCFHGRAKLFAIPGFARRVLKAVKPGLYNRLFGSFVINNGKTNQKLDFVPPVSTAEGVAAMVRWYRERFK
ncbi:MAG TPA: NAD-dependent epimerase/dehydratase family protein [Chitinophagaceae bacterium]